MADRLELQSELEELLGSRNVYFNPPESLKMKYPCIRYSAESPDVKRANNGIYMLTRKYEGVVIDPNPDSIIAESILNTFQMCSLGSPYPADNLNHFPFTLYY